MPFAERVVVTGIGAITSLGFDRETVFRRLVAGESGISWIDRFPVLTCPSKIGGLVRGFVPSDFFSDRATLRNVRVMDDPHQWLLAAASRAMQEAGLERPGEPVPPSASMAIAPSRLGISLGLGQSGRGTAERLVLDLFEAHREEASRLAANFDRTSASDVYGLIGDFVAKEANPVIFFQQCPSVAASYLAMRYHAMGPNLSMVSLCAASAQAIGEAAWVISRGDADVMITGGTDSLLNIADLSGFYTLQAVSGQNDPPERACKPFDLRRDGCVVGEGAVALVLERLGHARRRGAHILAELVGYGTSADAYKISAPPDDGEGAVQAMERAMAHANLEAHEVDHINAHGTATPLNDRIETHAIKRVFGAHASRIPVVSTKSMTGHLIAAAGALEALASIETIRNGVIPPTINLERPDPACDLDYVPNQARQVNGLRVVLSNSFAIGGVNATLIFKRYDNDR